MPPNPMSYLPVLQSSQIVMIEAAMLSKSAAIDIALSFRKARGEVLTRAD